MTLPSRSARPPLRGRTLPLLALAALTLLTLQPTLHTPARGLGHRGTQQQQRPLDPLTDDERQKAARIAQDDTRSRTMLGAGRQRVISVELADVKPPEAATARPEDPDRPLQTARLAEVLYFNYERNEGVRVVVDLSGSRVREVSRLDANGVPLAFEEIEEAAALALRNAELRSLLGPSAERYRAVHPDRDRERDGDDAYRVEGLRIVATGPGDPCYRHRCVSLLFRRGQEYLTYTEVTVDLTSKRVRVERTGRR